MGDKAADEVRDTAAARGTAMHTYLEHYLDGTGYKDLTTLGKQAEVMANKIIEAGLGDLEELWGLETTLVLSGPVRRRNGRCGHLRWSTGYH